MTCTNIQTQDSLLLKLQKLCRTDGRYRQDLSKCQIFLSQADTIGNIVLKKRCLIILLAATQSHITRAFIAREAQTSPTLVAKWINNFIEGGYEAVIKLHFKQRVPSAQISNQETSDFLCALVQVPPFTLHSSTCHGLALKLQNSTYWQIGQLSHILSCTNKSLKLLFEYHKIDLGTTYNTWQLHHVKLRAEIWPIYHQLYEHPPKDSLILCCDSRMCTALIDQELRAVSHNKWYFKLPHSIGMHAAFEAKSSTLFYLFYNSNQPLSFKSFLKWLLDNKSSLLNVSRYNIILGYEQNLAQSSQEELNISFDHDQEPWPQEYAQKFRFFLAPEHLPKLSNGNNVTEES